MAKFKKKKSKPTPEPEDSKKKTPQEEPVDIPETEKTESPPEPSKEPSISEAEKSEKDRKLNKLFWLRVALAVIAGTAATFIFEDIEGEDRRWASYWIYDYSVLWNNYCSKRNEDAITIIR